MLFRSTPKPASMKQLCAYKYWLYAEFTLVIRLYTLNFYGRYFLPSAFFFCNLQAKEFSEVIVLKVQSKHQELVGESLHRVPTPHLGTQLDEYSFLLLLNFFWQSGFTHYSQLPNTTITVCLSVNIAPIFVDAHEANAPISTSAGRDTVELLREHITVWLRLDMYKENVWKTVVIFLSF